MSSVGTNGLEAENRSQLRKNILNNRLTLLVWVFEEALTLRSKNHNVFFNMCQNSLDPETDSQTSGYLRDHSLTSPVLLDAELIWAPCAPRR